MIEYDTTPFIKIGNGTSNFYTNLCKAYLKNHKQIYVIGGGYKILTALWVYVGLHNDFHVSNIQHMCLNYLRMHSMCRFTVKIGNTPKNDDPIDIVNEVKIKNTENISELTHNCCAKLLHNNHIVVTAVGSSCVKAFFVASQLVKNGFYTYVYPMEILNNDKFVVKIKVYKSYCS